MSASVQIRRQSFRVVFGLWLLIAGAVNGTTFTDVGTNLPGLSQGWMAWGDYNNDGRLDLVAAGMDGGYNNQILLCRNNGNGTFTLVSNSLPAVSYTPVRWGDYDNDGRLDLLIGGSIYHNDGNGLFSLAFSLPDVNGSPTAWGDFNNDGRLDVVATDSNGLAMVYWNTGTNFVASGQSLFVGLVPYGCTVVADFDNDGWQDLLLCHYTGSYLFHNNGDGSFAYVGQLFPAVNVGATVLADFDGDGKVDLFITGSGQATLYRNLGTNTFVNAGSPVSGMASSTAAWGDFDGDGRPDLWVSGSPTNGPTLTRLFRNTPGGFVNSGIALPAMYYPSVAWGDFNNDGTLDVACFGWGVSGPETHIYRNDGTPSNAPPAAPTGLTAVQSNNLVILSWQAATDPNQTNSLTYNVRIGSTPGGIDVLSPMADAVTGWRLLPERGNAGERLFAIFNLPNGTNYYWSVQAIDNGFVGGPFAAENSFHLDVGPVISAIPNQTIRFSTSTPPLPFTIADFETPPDQLLLSASSSNTNLLPLAGVVFSRAGSNCTVTLTPTPHNVGTSLVTLVVGDPQGRMASNSFVLYVTNAAPTISQSPNLRVLPDAVVPPVAFEIGDTETPAADLAVTLTLSNSNLLQSSLITGTDSNRTLSLTLKPEQRGRCLVSIVVQDPVGATATNAFTLEVADFEPQTSGLPDVQQGAVDWGDYDNDGRLDVLICGRLANGTAITRIYHNDGNGTFTDIQAGLPGISSSIPPTVSWGDFNGDNRLDFVLAGGGVTRVYRNNGDGTFTDIAAGLPVSVSAAWVDYDNDGNLDLVLARGSGVSPSATLIYRNNGDGTFTNTGVTLPAALAVAPADFDNDGDEDLLLGGAVDKQVATAILMRNDGNGVFTNIGAGFQAVNSGSWAWGDYDQDGWLDLLMTGISGNNSYTALYHNNTNNTFTLVTTNLPGVSAGLAVWGDLDNDGLPDIFLTGLTAGRTGGRVASIYHNNGGGVFVDSGEPLAGTQWSAAGLGDFDSDGLLDVLYCGATNGLSGGSSTLLYRNGSGTINTPPTAPTGLTVLPGAILSWNPSTDAQTTNAGGLTYNLRIGTNAGGCQIMSPEADVVTGLRRVARMGNVGPVTHWQARLGPGTYYWSVQAIDPAFAGSVFSAESSFTIPRAAAVITGALLVQPGQFRINFDGETNLTYRVLISSNLFNWTILGNATEITPGKFEFLDSTATSTPRFYRVSSP
ncbi:MAG TPA: VCBS repeat-containing protein [Candidatus Acidoferrales bacterium]|nr:VCBS repeat-containing protein [Candidatus Acidoferrales bacterium]